MNKFTTPSLQKATSPLPSGRGSKDGFTLVELSIVLVIIGLLIGGILAAQSMISTAKINSLAMQVGQFDAGVENFKTKYNYLPGDAPAFGGDGNGIITGYNASISCFDCEVANFWLNIDPQQFPATPICNSKGMKVETNGPNKNVPLSKLGKSGSYFIASTAGATYGDRTPNPATAKNYYIILDPSQVQSQLYLDYWQFSDWGITPNNAALRPIDMLGLDKKIDDGKGDSGIVIEGYIGYSAPIAMDATTQCLYGSSYNLGHSEYLCTPMIRIGAGAGDPQ